MQRIARRSFLAALGPLPWAAVLAYLSVYLFIDWASFIRPLQGLNITPWNPQPALAVALLLASRRLWWVVLLGLLAAEVLVRGMPGDAFVVAAAAAALTCSSMAIATALQRLLGSAGRLADAAGVVRFLAIVAAGSLLSGLLYVGIFAMGGYLPASPWWQALARYWVGDTVGMIVTLPILLAAMNAPGRQRLWQTLSARMGALIVGLALLLPWLLLGDGSARFNFSYLMLLPVIGAAMRFGLPGAVLACAGTQVGLLVAVHGSAHQDMFVFELQLLMAAITTTGLLLGVVIDQRATADAELRRSLHLAAAGQMTAALAHELSQPLNALALYAQAVDVLAEPAAAPDAVRLAQLHDVARRMAADARRAGDVVRRLRDFFRSGSTQLQAVPLTELVAEAVAAQRTRADAIGATVAVELPPEAPTLWVDPVQIQVVLRNLLANALEAVAGTAPPGAARVTLRARERGGMLEVDVLDNGPGLDALRAHGVFEPGGSDKAAGMGIGLGISRAIVEAHGGRLWAESAGHGHFCFTLPTGGQHGGQHGGQLSAEPDAR